MTGDQGAGAPLPAEVPREFADAYREAYEAALAAHAELKPGTHAARRWRPSSGTRGGAEPSSSETQGVNGAAVPASRSHPNAGPSQQEQDRGDSTAYERARDSVWFVPLLLVLLLGLMLVGAYVLGRVFATHVGA